MEEEVVVAGLQLEHLEVERRHLLQSLDVLLLHEGRHELLLDEVEHVGDCQSALEGLAKQLCSLAHVAVENEELELDVAQETEELEGWQVSEDLAVDLCEVVLMGQGDESLVVLDPGC